MSVDLTSHRGRQRKPDSSRTTTDDRNRAYSGDVARLNGHELLAIDEWLPGKAPTPYDIDLTDGYEYRTRYWGCRNCGQERNQRSEFDSRCTAPQLPSPIE